MASSGLDDLEKFFDECIRAVKTGASVANNQMANELIKVYMSFASGPYSQEQLTEMGHPYAKRNSLYKVNGVRVRGMLQKPYSSYPNSHPGILNVQTGMLRRSFVKEQSMTSSGIREYSVYNADPKAVLVEDGDAYTIARPIRELAIAYVDGRYGDILQEEITKRLAAVFA